MIELCEDITGEGGLSPIRFRHMSAGPLPNLFDEQSFRNLDVDSLGDVGNVYAQLSDQPWGSPIIALLSPSMSRTWYRPNRLAFNSFSVGPQV